MYTAVYNAQSRNIHCAKAINKKIRYKRLLIKLFKLVAFFILLLLIFLIFCSAKNILKNKYGFSFNKNNSSDYLQLQQPELPNGCEATSLAMALTASGTPCDKLEAYAAVPSSDFVKLDNGLTIGANPLVEYAGDAATDSGFYCFSTPITLAANQILQQNGSTKTAVDITGANLSEINNYLKQKVPVIMWVTINFEPPSICQNFSWIISDSAEKYFPYSNLHCVMLNSVNNNVYEILDPLSGVIYIEENVLKQIYTEMGSRAVIIK